MPPAMEPASSIVKKLGGPTVIAKLTGCALSTPYDWQKPRDRKGTGGLVPQRYHRTLIDYARRHGIRLSAEDFLPAAAAERPKRRRGAAA
jgi:hypothetical protein